MKIIGVIGGIGPESTIEYYRFLIEAYRETVTDGTYPAIVINSINLKDLVDLFTAHQLEQVTRYLLVELSRLERAGAQLALLAANTPHIVFDELRRQSPLPLVSIVEAGRDEAAARGWKRAGLFGTRFTMQGGFYQKVWEAAGIGVVVPEPAEQYYIHEKYMVELVAGVIKPETRANLLEIAGRMKERDGIDGLILGGTELPMILRDAVDAPVPVLDTARVHARRAMAELLGKRS